MEYLVLITNRNPVISPIKPKLVLIEILYYNHLEFNCLTSFSPFHLLIPLPPEPPMIPTSPAHHSDAELFSLSINQYAKTWTIKWF